VQLTTTYTRASWCVALANRPPIAMPPLCAFGYDVIHAERHALLPRLFEQECTARPTVVIGVIGERGQRVEQAVECTTMPRMRNQESGDYVPKWQPMDQRQRFGQRIHRSHQQDLQGMQSPLCSVQPPPSMMLDAININRQRCMWQNSVSK
jgi:hypothetical protein